ncbi:hypothetical protein PRUPE_7G030900 [Prunus persica]|uniref:Uncharacterized protein n=1 Tax=Prunus persica TaxID=3760 RepID=M5W5N7_PRUPE|nr:hypothetical protein PRUPE_7G030900 [Prunus persica]
MNNPYGGDKTRGIGEVLTRAEFETLFAVLVERLPLLESNDESEEEFQEQPPIAPNQNNHNQYMDDFRIKADIPYFNGHLQIEDFLDWLVEVECFFEIMEVLETKMVKTAFHLNGSAAQLMMGRFLHADYEQYLYRLYHNCHQGNQTVSEYMDEFLHLAKRNNLEETDGQMVSWYITWLRSSLHEKIGLQILWTVHKAQSMALKAELLEKDKRIGLSISGIQKSSYEPSAPSMEKNKDEGSNINWGGDHNKMSNAYARPTNDICYRCSKPGHHSNECPTYNKQVNLV